MQHDSHSAPQQPSHAPHASQPPQPPHNGAQQTYAWVQHGPGQPPGYVYQSVQFAKIPPQALAGRGARLGARIIDLILWIACHMAVAIPLMPATDTASAAQTILLLGWLLLTFLCVFPFSILMYGTTLGKRLCGLRVVRSDPDKDLTYWRVLAREFMWLVAHIVPVLSFLNPLWCCWDKPLQQCLHDKLADTVVVQRNVPLDPYPA
ncbi:RDD family protein [Streptomyces monticola]|uniref:RDD family protein n=1 Tax=Streptomyces monticola TaxID=2666263 RepID=A0ABW2JN17_9ACTN